MLDFGMPMGPLRLIDEVGVDIAEDVAQTLAAAFPERMKVPVRARRMLEAGLLGRKTRQRLLRLSQEEGRRAGAEPRGRHPAAAGERTLEKEELQRRMVLLMVNEAARCLEEKIVESAGDVDSAMVMGTGFAPFRGGPLRYADSVGIEAIVAAANATGRRAADRTSRHVRCSRRKPAATNDSMKTDTMPRRSRAPVIDTSKMSPEQRAALELTEAAREAKRPKFRRQAYSWDSSTSRRLHPYPGAARG